MKKTISLVACLLAVSLLFVGCAPAAEEAAPAAEEAAPAAEEAAPAEVTAPAEEEVEEITSLDEIFTLKPEMLEVTSVSDEEEDTSSSGQKTESGKKKKKKFREVEYDPDRDITYVRRKHKNEEGGSWDW